MTKHKPAKKGKPKKLSLHSAFPAIVEPTGWAQMPTRVIDAQEARLLADWLLRFADWADQQRRGKK